MDWALPRWFILLLYGDIQFLEMSRGIVQKANCAGRQLRFLAIVPYISTGERRRDVPVVQR